MGLTAQQKIKFATNLTKLLSVVCGKRGVIASIEPRLVAEVVEYYSKDLKRIKEHQQHRVAFYTRIGFLVFWLGKLKPIVSASKDGKPLYDANEQASIWAAHVLFASIPACSHVPKEVERVAKEASLRHEAMKRTFDFYVQKNYQTLVYGIRHRNLTGDALSLLFGAVYNSFVFRFSQ